MHRRQFGAAFAATVLAGTSLDARRSLAQTAQPPTFQAAGDPLLNFDYRQIAVAEGLEHPWSIA